MSGLETGQAGVNRCKGEGGVGTAREAGVVKTRKEEISEGQRTKNGRLETEKARTNRRKAPEEVSSENA